ncbi:MAG: hypothetical protein GEU90_16665 [Gemmatimonas sp.]|nr:hypothetical protein [Gemmatimonas sp.]
MRVLQLFGATVGFIASIFLLRVVLHGYTEHAHLDLFHLTVGTASGFIALIFLRRALSSRGSGLGIR